MNGRVYDPQIGRFLSPDNYVQAPDFSQSFNRYSYCLNNPLKYTDPSGEEAVLLTTLLISAAIAGTINVATNYQNIDNWGRGLAYFAVGAAIGAAGSYVGGLAAYATLATGILPGAVVGGVSGAITSGSLQVANNYITGDTWYNKLGSSMLSGAIGGAINGGVYGFNRANATGANYWWGTKPEDWARNRNQWSLAWWEKPEVYRFTTKNINGNIPNGCTYATMKSISKSLNIKGQNQEYWRKSYEIFSGNKLNRPKASNFREWLLLEGYNTDYISISEIPSIYEQNKRIITIIPYKGDDLHMMPLKKAIFYPNGDYKLKFMNPDGGSIFIINNSNIMDIKPALYEIYR